MTDSTDLALLAKNAESLEIHRTYCLAAPAAGRHAAREMERQFLARQIILAASLPS